MKKKIAIVCHSMGGGGAERFITYLVDGLMNEYELHLLLFERRIEYDLPAGLIVHYLEDELLNARKNIVSIFRLGLAIGRLKKYCAEHKIDAVVSFLNRPNYVACAAKILGLRSRVILNEQQNSRFWYRNGFFRKIFGNFLVTRLYPFADAIIPNSLGIKLMLENEYGIQNNYFVTNNIVDSGRVTELSNEEVSETTPQGFTFVYAGRMYEGKGHRVLIEAFGNLRQKDCALVLLGKGELEEELKQVAKELGIEQRVRFLGFQANPFKYMKRADCFIMTSESEGSPNVLVEAMVCGLPIISTDCLTGPRELLSPGTDPLKSVKNEIEISECGILVPVGDRDLITEAMNLIISEEPLREKLRTAGKNRSHEYNAENVIPAYKDFLARYL